ncbi:DUF155-domain-containing protein [Gonapodya prolifera JEL478]|uniref:DUF155-domain-containing protein n=1 Tax=Gonapodya prolifera (strain JEL478) TaxID=1344416 RepID=A0A139AXL9_GONPJ|nr:DUF155-domain-containing protein [Gonapodya prolifera JEL478]|eukprot:KXS21478.1 DUF155-domain-containing protein [Gonapodya prolifera JEL478]
MAPPTARAMLSASSALHGIYGIRSTGQAARRSKSLRYFNESPVRAASQRRQTLQMDIHDAAFSTETLAMPPKKGAQRPAAVESNIRSNTPLPNLPPRQPPTQQPPVPQAFKNRILAGVSRARSVANGAVQRGAFSEDLSAERQLQAPRGKQKGVRGVGSENVVMTPAALIGAPAPEARRAMAFATAERYDLDDLLPLLEASGYSVLDHLTEDVLHVVFPPVATGESKPGKRATETAGSGGHEDTLSRRHSGRLENDDDDTPLVRHSDSPARYSLASPVPPPTPPTVVSRQHFPDEADSHLFSDVESPPLPEAFIFANGTFVTWGASERENQRLMGILRGAEIDAYSAVETEWFDYVVDMNEPGGLVGDVILIGSDLPPAQSALAFSSGLSRSVKLAALEDLLDRHLEENRAVPTFLAAGRRLPMGQKEVLSKLGELLVFRGSVNLHSELLDAPDFCWSNERMEQFFESASRNLDVRPRIAVFNKKLDYANELAATLRDHLSERHSNNLEWIIIVLITVEVVSEAVHYAERLGYVDLDRFRKGSKEPVVGWRWAGSEEKPVII